MPNLDGAAQQWQDWVGITSEAARSQILLIDPTSSGINDLISGLDYAYPGAEKIGGIAAPHNTRTDRCCWMTRSSPARWGELATRNGGGAELSPHRPGLLNRAGAAQHAAKIQ